MLRAYCDAVLAGEGQLDKQITGAVESHTTVTVTVPADMIADFAPVFLWSISINLQIHSEAHAAKAGEGNYQENILMSPIGTLCDATAGTLQQNPYEYRLTMAGTMTQDSRSHYATAHGRYGHMISGELFQTLAETAAGSITVPLPSAGGQLDKEFVGPIVADVGLAHVVAALMDCLRNLFAMQAGNAFSITTNSNLGRIMYADMVAIAQAILANAASLDSEGGQWQYPSIVGTDAIIYQVWLTEQNRAHLFLDPQEAIHHVQMQQDFIVPETV